MPSYLNGGSGAPPYLPAPRRTNASPSPRGAYPPASSPHSGYPSLPPSRRSPSPQLYAHSASSYRRSPSPPYAPAPFSPHRPSPSPSPPPYAPSNAPSFASGSYVSPYTPSSTPRRRSDEFQARFAGAGHTRSGSGFRMSGGGYVAGQAPRVRRSASGGGSADGSRRYNLPGEDFRTRGEGGGERSYEGREGGAVDTVRFASTGSGHGGQSGHGHGGQSGQGHGGHGHGGERGGGKDRVVAKKDGGGGYLHRFAQGSLDNMNLARMSDIAQEIVVALHRASRDQGKGKKRRTNQENVFILGKLLASVGITPESHGGKYRIYLDKLGQLEKRMGNGEGEAMVKAFLESPQGKVLKKQLLQYGINAAKAAR